MKYKQQTFTQHTNLTTKSILRIHVPHLPKNILCFLTYLPPLTLAGLLHFDVPFVLKIQGEKKLQRQLLAVLR